MPDTTRTINQNFTREEITKLKSLMKYEPEHDYIETNSDFKRPRASKLDPHLSEILKRRSQNWSYQRIVDELKQKYGFVKLNKSTMMRRINKFFEVK